MGKPNYSWKVTEDNQASTSLIPWLSSHDLPEMFAPLLWQRGIQTEEMLQAFFEPTPDLIHDPYLMFDMEKAVERIQEGIAMGQSILIYGDYDADGITSTTVLKEAIETVGGEVSVYLPDRFKDGYGPNKETYKRLIEERGIELIVTVDNGVAGHDAIDYANSVGVDVVVTDHHEIPQELPNAYAIVHPRHPEGNYPFGELAGVGVAFKLATALLEELPEEMLDLVAIGTVADLVPLTGENRVLVQYGLEVMKQGQRMGLTTLLRAADIKPQDITEESIGFGIAPRLNAIGRLGDATPGVVLLSSFDKEEADGLANQINTVNQERQSIVKEISAEALAMINGSASQDIYVLAKEGWHVGVLGIVASKIVQETGRPALVLGIDPETGIAKGSGRSIEQINLYEALNSAAELFTAFGGHQMAAGMSLPSENLEKLQVQLNKFVEELQIDFSEGPTLSVDSEIDIADITIKQIQELRKLAPFGTDNPAPNFLITDVQPVQVKQIGADKNHLKFQVADTGGNLDCLAFNLGTEYDELATAEKVSVVGQLSINEWNGNQKPQVMINDFKIPGLQLLDKRGQKIKLDQHNSETTLFIYSDEKLFEKASEKTEHNVLIGNAIPKGGWTDIVLVDCPVEKAELKEMLLQLEPKKIFVYLTSKDEAYLNGMPSREQFGLLFKFIANQKNVDVRHKLPAISQYLKIKPQVLIFMIQVFSDLGFVTIENGLMNKVENPISRELEESKLYQQREKQMKTEEFLLYSKISELRDWLLN
ncbi:single-stranded-DNA-specific exonuclease RecJ [Vagococcus coleopterorum]|uniref:Single-stranded-DNA-specific exonuclease RecJ n=1 Tax=Vagococcus coleopterorum TaxID=2714946 RepID=A0A6G8AN95_9ENTE|nr:single-stranded-DNA-specific exonuclease RecJ [Vagococcus coleopterorum]QIL46467.1 single-stranded-DNA-specific exonuclease RecJ [Vagococcus coleopterorum]